MLCAKEFLELDERSRPLFTPVTRASCWERDCCWVMTGVAVLRKNDHEEPVERPRTVCRATQLRARPGRLRRPQAGALQGTLDLFEATANSGH